MGKGFDIWDAWFWFTRLVITEHESRRYVNGRVHDTMGLLLSAIITRDEHFKSPLCHTSFRAVKMRVKTENGLNQKSSFTSYRVRIVIPAQLVECVFHESGTI
jgi:hypothetical protein